MKKLALLSVVVLGAAWWFGNDHDGNQVINHNQSRSAVVNRVWIDKIPENLRDKIDVFVAQADPQFGAFQRTSAYEGDYTVFQWNAGGGNTFDITMLQTGKQYGLRAKVSRENCKQFDVCMTLRGAPRGTTHYYSMKEWVIDGTPTPERVQRFIRTKLLEAE